MNPADAIRHFVQDLREIDRKMTALRKDHAEKSVALRKLQAQEALSSPVVRRASPVNCG